MNNLLKCILILCKGSKRTDRSGRIHGTNRKNGKDFILKAGINADNL